MKCPLILLAGLPGTGKTTNAKHLEKRLDYNRFDALEARNQLGFTEFSDAQRPFVEKLIFKAVYDSIGNGKGSIVEASFGRLSSRIGCYKIAAEAGLEVVLIEHICPEMIAIGRMKRREAQDGRISAPNDPQVFFKIKNLWESIEGDLLLYPFLSLIRYDTYSLVFEDVRINKDVYGFSKGLEITLLNHGQSLRSICMPPYQG